MRWDNGAMLPVGGWTKYSDVSTGEQAQFPETGSVKAAHSWFANASAGDGGASYFLAGATHSNVYIMNGLGEITDTTPAGLTVGSETSYNNRGYGGGLYSDGLYGTSRPAEGASKVPATTWALDNYGEWLLAVNTTDRSIYKWAPGNQVMTELSGAPSCLSMVTTEERFVFALAAEDSTGVINVRRVAWCDREDPETWDATATNEAGGFELQTDGAIRCGVRVRGRTLIITTTDAHIAQYSGPPLVYGFQRVGKNCGVISDRAVATTGEGAFWMGLNDFYFYDGSVVRELPCDVHDYVYRFINRSYIDNTYAVANAKNNEIWWFYTSTASQSIQTDDGGLIAYNDRYVSYDYKQNIWSFGEISRMSGVDSGVFDDPVWIDEENKVWRHELYAQKHEGSLPWAETGPVVMGYGDQVINATQVLTDAVPDRRINLEFKTRFEPQGEEFVYGPYDLAPKVDVRFSGRQMRMKISAIEDLEPTENHDFRVGDFRVLVDGMGRR